ncbi:TPA: hypothetical protein ROY17_005787 [Bacillus thuringiensis]|nr:hypothetical protein [Bacillus thuringiensis]
MITLQRVKKLALGVTMGLVSLSVLQSPTFAASQVKIETMNILTESQGNELHAYEAMPESAQDRIDTQNAFRDYAKILPEKKLTVLIAADEQYRQKHPDWKFYTRAFVEDGTRDFKEYFNIKYVPVQFLEWKSDGKDPEEILDDLAKDYGSYAQNQMKNSINFSLVVGFIGNPNYGKIGGNAGVTVSLSPDNGGKSAIIGINEDNRHDFSMAKRIKHEVTHTYTVPNDPFDYRKSVMSSNDKIIDLMDWSSTEMRTILFHREDYQNREIKEVTSFNNKLKVNRTGNLFFTEVMSSPQANLGYINGYAQVDIDIDKKPFADFHMLETVNSINERLNSVGMVGNEITFNRLFSPNAGSINPTDTYKFN